MNKFYKNPLMLLTVLFAMVVMFLGYRVYVKAEYMKVGGSEIYINNDTSGTLKIYSSAERKYITRSLQPGTSRTFGPFCKKMGAPGTSLRIECKKWDRPLVVDFKGREHTFSKKIVENRKKKGKRYFSGTPIRVQVDADWPLIATQDGYDINIKQISKKELPNFGIYLKRLFGFDG